MKNPIEYSLKTEIWPLVILLAAISLSFWSYPQLPNQVVSHWNFYGQADGWSSREFHAIFFPALLVALYGLFNIIPRLDPKSDRYVEFAKVYRIIRSLILTFLLIVFATATFSNLGYAVNIGATIVGMIGLLMITLGNYFGKIKRNWFVGIRTPWTLSSDNVWNKTHRLGGRLFMIWGFGLIFCSWLSPAITFIVLIGGMIVIISWVTIYSYLLYKEEKKQK